MTLVAKTRHSTAHKKRKAAHHRQSKQYHKPYYPFIPVMLLIVGAGVLLNSFWMKPGQVLGDTSDFTTAQLISETNKQRADNQLPALNINSKLTNAAQSKAEDMVGKNYWSHTSPDSKTFNSFIVESGYGYQAAGENLAYGFGDASQVIKGWMNSPEHRKNLLGEKYRDVGFGIASSPNYMDKGPAVLVVAEYGQPAPEAATNVTFTVATPPEGEVKSGAVESPSQNVARIQLLTGDTTSWSLIIVSAIMGACLALFIVRHGLRIHRMVSSGEKFIVKHPWLDVGFVFLITAGFVLTRTGGLIH